jgi:glycosyltransferase involved in cell wall biosynthesis
MPSSLTILHISTRLILGGSQENTVLSCEGQARLGHQIHLAFGPIYGPEGSLLDRVNAFRTGDGSTIQTHTIPELIREVNPRRDLRAYRQLKDLIAQIRPDVVHTHSSKAGIVGRAASWASWPRPATIHTIHGPPFMPIEGSPTLRLKTRLLNTAYTLAEQFAAHRCHAIVSVADAMTQQFLARGIGAPGQYSTIRSGMEIEPFLHAAPGEDRASVRARLGIAPADFVVGTVARLAEHKGHDDLLDALGDELRSRPDWKLLWVGDGWWRERLMQRLESMGLQGRIVTTGLVEPQRVPGLIRAMDVLAHPSSREGLPRTVPQALLAGVCPVAYDVDGTREACIDGQTGLLVPHGDRAALHNAICRLFDDPDLRQSLADRGRALCREAFSTERMVRDLDELYRRTLTHARAE